MSPRIYPQSLEIRAINAIRFLSLDMIDKAHSGHPGLPLGCAALAYTIWIYHLRHNPKNPNWIGRDRFILSGGHGSALLYSMLFLTGYDISLDELMAFRQWGSMTPGHPEYGQTPGVEVTTGPLGQGFANGVGMAIAHAHLASEFNRTGYKLLDSIIYGIVTDGDLMEGVSAEAASIAGHLKLGNIIYLYDNNHVSIDGPTNITFTESVRDRFIAYGWHVLDVDDGKNVQKIHSAISAARNDPRPSLLICNTTIGFGLPSVQGTNKAHGEPPCTEDLMAAKSQAGWPLEPRFFVPKDVLAHFRDAINKGHEWEKKWQRLFYNYQRDFPERAADFERRLAGELPDDYLLALPEFKPDNGAMATREASGVILNRLAAKVPELMGGAADLSPSTKTWLALSPAFQFETPEGRNLFFGVREHAMGAIVNGMAVFGCIIPFGATFLVFSDYMRAPIRLSALSSYPCIWVFTHDSIGVGEDGPTHQPVEQITSLRAIPGLTVIRPADANETAMAWKIAIEMRGAPVALILSRQQVPILDQAIYATCKSVERGAYILTEFGDKVPDIILMASGSEVHIALEAGRLLADEKVASRIVSFPSWELFERQSIEYQNMILPTEIKNRISIEAGITLGWERWTGASGISIGVDRFGASAPYKTIFQKYDLSVEKIVHIAKKMVIRI